jgi:hypothetical protein
MPVYLRRFWLDLTALSAYPSQNGLDVMTGAARHRVPLRTIKNLQEAVVVTKARKADRRKSQNGFDRA